MIDEQLFKKINQAQAKAQANITSSAGKAKRVSTGSSGSSASASTAVPAASEKSFASDTTVDSAGQPMAKRIKFRKKA